MNRPDRTAGVSAPYQQLGLGQAILLAAMKRAIERGAEAIRVYAESYNKVSQGMYAAAGFQEAFYVAFFLGVVENEGCGEEVG